MSSKSPTNQALTGCALVAAGLGLIAIGTLGFALALFLLGGS
jgi:preprotein translocase subunit Sss1